MMNLLPLYRANAGAVGQKAKAFFSKKALSKGIVAGFFILLIGLLWLGFRDVFYAWELNTLSVRQRLFSLPPASRSQITPLALVNYDDKTGNSADFIRLFGDPMSRSAPAYAARFLRRAGARNTVFDLSFNGGVRKNDRAGDQALVDSAGPAPPLISSGKSLAAASSSPASVASSLFFNTNPDLGFERQSSQVQNALLRNAIEISGLDAFPLYKKLYTHAGLAPPYPALLASGMHFYAANSTLSKSNLDDAVADLTGESRRWTPFAFYGSYAFPTMALGTVLKGERRLHLTADGILSWGTPNQSSGVHLGVEGLPLIKWYGHGVLPNQPVYPEFSLSDVVFSEMALECRENPALPVCSQVKLPTQPTINPAWFKNRYVLIGMTLANAGDTHQTIYGPHYFGVYILANILDNLIHDDFVLPAPAWCNALGFLLLPLLLIMASRRFKSVPFICLLTLTLAVGYFLLSVFCYNRLNVWLYVVYPILALLGCFVGLFIYRFLKEQRQRQQLRFAFGKYVSPSVMEMIERNPKAVRLGGTRREMTFLFSDIRGFTTFSDRNPPEVVQNVLTNYFSRMNGIILHDYHGSINKLIGDAIMAYWGFPLEHEDHAFLAVCAAMAMRDELRRWRDDPNNPPFHIGIGVNTGEAVIGNVGSEDFMDFTVIGDAVNVAARLEQLNKEYKAPVIISAATYHQVKDRIRTRYLGVVRLAGKDTDTEVYEPLELMSVSDGDEGSVLGFIGELPPHPNPPPPGERGL
jgi:class 3 adenylate cyclase/CHASE2 domain-containing sensor protein